jgi:hypothetical protein
MKKVYVIGAGTGLNASKEAIIVLNLNENDEIICVNSIEDVPLEERIKSDPAVIQYIHKFTARPELPELNLIDIRKDKKKKGHERPYKFHR